MAVCDLLSFNRSTCLQPKPADLGSDPGSSTGDGGAVGGSLSVKGGSWLNRARGVEAAVDEWSWGSPRGSASAGALLSSFPCPLRPQELRASIWRTWACWGEGVRDCGFPPEPVPKPPPPALPLLSFSWKFLHFPYKNG